MSLHPRFFLPDGPALAFYAQLVAAELPYPFGEVPSLVMLYACGKALCVADLLARSCGAISAGPPSPHLFFEGGEGRTIAGGGMAGPET